MNDLFITSIGINRIKIGTLKSMVKRQYGQLAISFIVGGLAVFIGQKLISDTELISATLVAEVGDYKITLSDFQRQLKFRAGEYRSKIDPSLLLEEIIQERAMLNYAKQQHLTDSPDYQKSINGILIGKLKSLELQPKLDDITISTELIEQYYQQNKAEFITQGRSKYAILFLSHNKSNSQSLIDVNEQKLKEARTIAIKQPTNQNFGKLAISYSEHQTTRYRGGELGWLLQEQKSTYPVEFLAATKQLIQRGQISPIVQTPKGLYLIKLLNRLPVKIKSLSKVKNKIYYQLMLAEQSKITAGFEQKILATNKVVRYFDNLPKQISSIENDSRLPTM